MRRVAVLGCGGSGKTTLARELGRRLGIEVVHADFLRYGADGIPVPEAEWLRRHDAVLRRETWIFDAMKVGQLERRLAAADTAIFLDLSRRACLLGLVRRRLRYRGRVDSGLGVADRLNWEFVRWVWRFRRDTRPRVLALLDGHRTSVGIVRLCSRRQVRAFLATAAAPNHTAPGEATPASLAA